MEHCLLHDARGSEFRGAIPAALLLLLLWPLEMWQIRRNWLKLDCTVEPQSMVELLPAAAAYVRDAAAQEVNLLVLGLLACVCGQGEKLLRVSCAAGISFC